LALDNIDLPSQERPITFVFVRIGHPLAICHKSSGISVSISFINHLSSLLSYVLSAPSKMLDTLPGTLMLTDCLEACQNNESCSAVNYETGLCVLFKTTADKLPGELESVRIPNGCAVLYFFFLFVPKKAQ